MRTRLRAVRWRFWKNWQKTKPTVAKIMLYSLITIVIIAVMLAVSFWADWFPKWTGIGKYESVTIVQSGTSTTKQTTIIGGKTLWDLLELLIVPLALTSIAIWLNQRVRETEQRTTNEQLQEDALHTYFDRMSELSLDHNLYGASQNSDVRFIARSRTLNIFQRLNGERKGVVLSFLYSLGLIRCKMGENRIVETYPIITLTGADLSGLSVPGGALTSANLKDVWLSNVDLSGADLSRVDLTNAMLSISWLTEADLSNAQLCGANLELAILIDTKLDGANLSGANLKHAYVLPSQLAKAEVLQDCVMPNGIIYDSQKPLDEQCEWFREKDVT